MRLMAIIITFGLLVQCKPTKSDGSESFTNNTLELNDYFSQIDEKVGQYVVDIFEDSKGNIWFATLSKGIAKFDGSQLIYYTDLDGLVSNACVDVEEDTKGNIWIATQNGLSKFDGNTFENYLTNGSPDESRISCITFDTNGNLWIGSWAGVRIFDGMHFKTFDLPIPPDISLESYQTTMNWVTQIVEDANGAIWIARDGYGICKYTQDTFEFINESDGLLSSNVMALSRDNKEQFWIGTRVVERDHPSDFTEGKGGLSLISDQHVRHFNDKEGLYNADVYCIYKSSDGHIWISTTNKGLYTFDGNEFSRFEFQNKSMYPIQSILMDSQSRLWVGCSGGLFTLENGELVHHPVAKF